MPSLFSAARALAALFLAGVFAHAATGPIAFYPAENDASDLGPGHHNGTVPATAKQHFAPGKIGSAFHFDGTEYVDLGSWFTEETATFGFWIKDAASAGAPQVDGAPLIVVKSAAGVAWSIRYNAAAGAYVYSSDDGASPIQFVLTAGTWQYLAITRDGATRQTRIYISGAQNGFSTGTSDIGYDFGPSIRLGSESLTTFWKGDIDEIRVYNRVLSPEELSLISANGTDVVVPGTANPYLADPANDNSGDGPAAPAGGISVAGGNTIRFSTAGSVSYAGTPTDYPDGSSDVAHGPQAGISASTYPANALLGVFLDDSPSTSSAAPAGTDFSASGTGRNFSTLAPALKQIFFIGDGVTDTGTIQTFTAPAGATRLFLGMGDGSGWYNNGGSFSVHVVNPDAPTGLSATQFTINSNTSPGAITPGASLHLEAVQSGHPNGLHLRAQTTSTPDVEGSWTDLNDGTGGTLKPAAAANHYYTDTAAYPGGSAIYFRVIASAPAQADSISNVVGPFDLKQAHLTIHASAVSDSDPLGHAARAGDTLTYTLTFGNDGNAPAKSLLVAALVPNYIQSGDTTNSQRQFAAADITPSLGGEIVNVADLAGTNTQWVLPGGDAIDRLDSQGNPRKAIRWYVGDLDVNATQFVRYSVKITSAVKVPSTITSSNVYAVSSTIGQPPFAGDEKTSDADIFSVDVRGPISITVSRDIGATTPGGVLSYLFTVTNLSGTLQRNAVAAIEVPDFARFDEVYPDVAGKQSVRRSGVSVLDSRNKVLAKQPSGFRFIGVNPIAGAPQQVLFSLGNLRPNASFNFRVSFQAKWVDPAEVPSIRLTHYAAAFLNLDLASVITAALKKGSNQDFVAFVINPENSLAFSLEDSGIQTTALSGSLTGQPDISVTKAVGENPSTPFDPVGSEDQGNGERLNTVLPGGEITFLVTAKNHGANAAEDVYIQDRIPEGCVLVTSGKKPQVLTSDSTNLDEAVTFPLKSPSITASKKGYEVTLDPDQRTLRVMNLHLEPDDFISISYTVQVKTTGNDAPSLNSIVEAGSATVGTSSNTHTPVSLPGSTPIKVVGPASFKLEVNPAIVHPVPTDNIAAAADALTAVYSKNFNAPPWRSLIPDHVPEVFPGDQRFYVRYENTSGTTLSNVDLNIPVPANTVFYRASYVDTSILSPAPAGVKITTPQFLSSGGVVNVHFNKVKKGETGLVMVEVIVSSAAIQKPGSRVVMDGVEIHDGTSQAGVLARSSVQPRTSRRATLRVSQLADAQHIPKIGISKTTPAGVLPGDTFDVLLTVCNYGDVAADPLIFFPIPAGSQAVSYTYGSTTVQLNDFHPNPGEGLLLPVASGDAPVQQNQVGKLLPHTAAAVSIKLKSTVLLSSIVEDQAYVTVDYVGKIAFEPTSILPTVGGGLVSFGPPIEGSITAVTNVDFLRLPNGNTIIPLGGGAIVAQGGGNIVAQGGGNIVAQGGGNIVAQGGGNLIQLKNIASLGDTTGAGVLANMVKIVAQGGGNIFNTGSGNIISNDGASLIDNANTSLRVGTVAQIVAQGGGNIVAQGGGNIVAQGGGNIVAQGGGNIVAQGGGNIVAQGAGNIYTVGGAIVAQGGGNVRGSIGVALKTTGGSFALSIGGSSALLSQGPAGIVASGAGNFSLLP